MNNPFPFLRRVARLEGVSFLVLLGIAMPLKYLAGMPLAVVVVGWIHGVLFVVLCYALLRAMLVARLALPRAAAVFAAALLPFGPFVLDPRMSAWEEELTRRQGAPAPAGP